MKGKKDELLSVVLFSAFLIIMLLFYLLLPKKDFSETEKRFLKEAPVISADSLLSGSFCDDVETYMADHIPVRNFFVSLNSYYDLLSGRQISKDVRLLEGSRIVEAPIAPNSDRVERNMSVINAFAEELDSQVDLMIVPSAGWASDSKAVTGLDFFSREEYTDSQIIEEISSLAGKNISNINLTPMLSGREDYYYRTDHHWTSAGAYEVYAAYMNNKGRTPVSRENFTVESVADFGGSTLSRSALWLVPKENLELWHGSSGILVSTGEDSPAHEGCFYREHLDSSDKYSVYLDGNHPLVRVENSDKNASGKILVIRDSYSSNLGVFLAESYESVVLIDLRYFKNSVSELCEAEKFDDILICYSLSNFMTDTNIVWLK